jgi:hypothetical protein
MATMQDIVERAIQRLGVTPIGQSPDPLEIQDGLDALNEMMHAWKRQLGTDYSHFTLGASAPFPLANKFRAGVAAMLAFRLLDEAGKQASEQLVRDARNGWTALQAHFVSSVEDVEIDPGLTTTPADGRRTANILTGEDDA